MHKLKFQEAWFAYSPPIAPETLTNASVQKVATAFNANLKRTQSSVTFLPWMFARSQLQIRSLMIGKFKHEKPLQIFDGQLESNPELFDRVMAESHAIMGRFNASDSTFAERTLQLYQAGGNQFFVGADAKEHPDISEGVHSILQGMVIGFWTAIEVCLGDLLKEVKDGSAIAQQGSGEAVRIVRMQRASRKLPPAQLKPRSPKDSITSMLGAREAYARAFSCDSIAVDRALASTSFDSVALIRNALVHNNGAVDKIFRERAAGIRNLNRFSKSGCKQIRIAGQLVKHLIVGALPSVVALVKSADRWLTKNP
ncbi:MAG: hypothetical protein ACAI34_13900 [Verrucomicrobium sp.]